jgi:hypothetical protein
VAQTHDAELDRLKTAQDSSFQRKQTAYQAQDQAWIRRSAARDALARAHDEKQRAYDVQNAAWQDYQRLRANNGPRIDSLNSQQETAYENMKSAFDRASSAHDARDGLSARTYADQGHAYKAESQGYVTERRRLVQEIRDAKERHEATRPAFQRAKDQFDAAKRTYDAAKADHERKQVTFKRAKADFDQAATAFRKRLDVVKVANTRKKDDKRAIAQRAGVPHRYLDNVWLSTQSDGMINIYFGGVGTPNGLGHGHYVMDQHDRVVYKREPFDPHGAQNFEEAKDAALLYIRSARSNHEPVGTNEHGGVFYRRSDNGGTVLHITQYFADNYHVSWDATPTGNQNVHWTNKNVSKGHPDRFVSPSDAVL